MLEVSADEVISSEADLRARYSAPSELAIKKQLDHLDHNCRRFIALSPFLCLATSGEEGSVDNSPRGDAPGFVEVLDERTLLIPDRPGNNRLDSLANIIQQPAGGPAVLHPGRDRDAAHQRPRQDRHQAADPGAVQPSTAGRPRSSSWSRPRRCSCTARRR